ncbi:MAG TPA: hypothetical protein VH331_17465 [Allosphingosinicella sp.]|jgi:hypothetical protein|nr:hypothetical protein [Allosphingosinicella sp.]
MSLHDWLGRHAADTGAGHWDRGRYVSHCLVCGREMVKLPGLAWQLRGSAG